MIMNYMKFLLTVVPVLLMTASMAAADVDADVARGSAMSFIQSQAQGKRLRNGKTELRLVHTELSTVRAGHADYYVFNTEDDNAFIIVAGDDRAERILAYGDHAFDMSRIPANVQWWLDQYKAQIEWLVAHAAEENGVAKPPRLRAPAHNGTIEPLVTAQWSQDAPYYDQCPVYDGEYCATGCVATAMAQVMYYWHYPDSVPALPGYWTDYLGIWINELPAVQLDWDNMIDTYNRGSYTAAQGKAVAMLMRYCGQACFMDYTPEASGAYEMEQLAAMIQFGYNSDAACLYRDNVDDEQWNSMLLEDLSAGRPILYCGHSDSGGHAFILDGYDGEKYHVNWGWGGYYDGYYALDALGKNDWKFQYNHSMLYHLYPGNGSETAPKYDFEMAGIYYNIDGEAVQVANKGMGMNTYTGNVVIPESVEHEGKTYPVTSVAPSAFMNCLGLTSVTLPASIRTLGRNAFYNCRSLESVRILGSDMTIEDRAFGDCLSLKSVYVDDIKSWCSMTFTSLSSNPLTNFASLYDQQGNLFSDVVIPASVCEVKEYAFAICPNLRNVTLEEGITSVGYCAFYYCEDLASLSLPGSLQEMGSFAFAYSSLSELELHDGLTSIGYAAFTGCSNLSHVEIPNSVQSLDYTAFYECTGLTSVNLGQGVTYLGDYVFNSCTSLTNFEMPNSVTSIGCAVFAFDDALEEVTLSERLECIPEYTFYKCPALKTVTLHEGITAIGFEAFESDKSLTGINIPVSLTYCASSAFKMCSKLQRVDIADLKAWCNVTFEDQNANPLNAANHLYLGGEEVTALVIPDSVSAIKDYTFVNCHGIVDVTMGQNVKSIGASAFQGCRNMKEMTVSDGVSTIGDKAFYGCNKLSSLTFGNAVDSVGVQAFGNCNSLTAITSHAVTPPAMSGKSTFSDGTYNRATVYVPRPSLPTYKEALVWRRFSNLQGVNFNAARADVNGDGEIGLADVNALVAVLVYGLDDRGMACDVNGDGDVTIADVNAVVAVIVGE